MKKAICQVADTGPLESLVVMLRSVGYQCYTLNKDLKTELRRIGCDTVLDISGLVRAWGYEQPLRLPSVSLADMNTADLYIDIKAHRNGPKVWERWPNLKDKTLWYRINGGAPEITPKGGDEVNLVCPILTPNMWYASDGPWSSSSYTCWPPFYRFNDYYGRHGRPFPHQNPLCLIHNLCGWGYGALVENMRDLDVQCYGTGSPDGLISHSGIPEKLSRALCMVHLKSSDAPGYALYEAMAAACPLVVTRRLIWRNRMEGLLKPGVTCLVFDRETHDPLTSKDVAECAREVRDALQQLANCEENTRIGMAGHNRLKSMMWNESRDGLSLSQFIEEHFG